jgi:hypothetical protein
MTSPGDGQQLVVIPPRSPSTLTARLHSEWEGIDASVAIYSLESVPSTLTAATALLCIADWDVLTKTSRIVRRGNLLPYQ